MNTSKKININVSSLVGLKAELLRKHTEVKDAKAKIDTSKPALVNKAKVKKKNVNIKNDKVKKIEDVTEIEDVDTLKKSKYMLLAKAKLYDKLKKNREEGNDNYLVDFKNKNYESSEESAIEEDDYEDSNLDPEEDWIDYKDCFGRTRRCLRKDLPRMKEKDSLIEREITKKSHTEEIEEHIQPPAFIPPEKEPEIEIMRKKWEEQTEKLTKKADIHYQDILFDEARAHGVGYYAFSQDEEERTKQQLNLTKIRKETEQKQKELKEMQDLKNKMEENRLKTARIRARVRAGLLPEPTEEEIENNSPNEESTINTENTEWKSPKNDESVEQDLTKSKANDKNSLMIVEDKIKAFGELLGKRLPWRELSQDEWIDKRRKDRHGEFAPVYDNFKRGEKLVATRHNQLISQSNDTDDPLRIQAGGPEPTDFWESSAPSNVEDDDNTAAESDKSNKISVSGQSTDPMNFTEPPPFIQSIPSPLFDPSVPPPSINTNVSPALSIPAVNSTFIPLAPVFYPVPHPSLMNPAIPSEVTSNDLRNTEINHGCPMESTDSDDSDIIGPMPPPPPSSSTQDDDILARIPLPDQPPPTIREFPSSYSNKQSNNHSTNANIDKIEAGLKYLRRKFETNDVS
ncbi:hypothetical protein PV327_004847 [Microctonus hyperodae]|uniref:CCDC174 alpha/beta GRSR domain-containing protein n=1 Tax=Microctonus hyperodae TaxID=165561 RepID=A0AA39FDG8_MICHY|nr:hypothetical protein PV327_004847 [Microctonus hyperodae]